MIKTKRNYPEINPDDHIELRRKCFQLRMWGWHEVRRLYESMIGGGIEGLEGRDEECWLPLFVLMKLMGREDTDKDDLISYAKETIKLRRIDESLDSEKPFVVKGLLLLNYILKEQKARDFGPEATFWHKYLEDGLVELKISDLTKEVNGARGILEDLKEKAVGRHLTQLGFTSRGRSSDKAHSTTFKLDEAWLDRICDMHFSKSAEMMLDELTETG